MTDEQKGRAAGQSDPSRNFHFSRRWTATAAPPLRAWHADAAPIRFTSPTRARAEAAWRELAGEPRGVTP